MKYRNKFRVSRINKIIKSSIISYLKGDLPTYILNHVRDRLDNGEKEILIHMVLSLKESSIVEYLNEYHYNKANYCWDMEFLSKAYYLISDKLYRKLNSYSDINVEILDFSDTDKRILITAKD